MKHPNSEALDFEDIFCVSSNHVAMLSIFQTRYRRLEQALNSLVESISAYNPSLAAADELVAADDDVNESLEQCTQHDNHYPDAY